MNSQDAQSAEAMVQSPCVSNCCLDNDDICLGCHRSLDEITGWHSADRKKRLQNLELCHQRKNNR